MTAQNPHRQRADELAAAAVVNDPGAQHRHAVEHGLAAIAAETWDQTQAIKTLLDRLVGNDFSTKRDLPAEVNERSE